MLKIPWRNRKIYSYTLSEKNAIDISLFLLLSCYQKQCVCVIYLCHGWPPQSRCSWESLGKPQGNPETKWYHLVLSHHLRIELHDRADTRLAIPTCSSRSSTTICSNGYLRPNCPVWQTQPLCIMEEHATKVNDELSKLGHYYVALSRPLERLNILLRTFTYLFSAISSEMPSEMRTLTDSY